MCVVLYRIEGKTLPRGASGLNSEMTDITRNGKAGKVQRKANVFVSVLHA